MGRRCVAAQSWAGDVLLPEESELRKNLADQVKRTREKWEPTDHSDLCSKHFEDDCFQPNSKLAESLGVGKVRVLLKKGAIPTIFERPSKKRKISSLEPAANRRTVVEKRDRSRA